MTPAGSTAMPHMSPGWNWPNSMSGVTGKVAVRPARSGDTQCWIPVTVRAPGSTEMTWMPMLDGMWLACAVGAATSAATTAASTASVLLFM
jgi:hypothetical protein